MRINSPIAGVFLLTLTWVVGGPAGADQRGGPWTADDSGAVADAVIAAASEDKSRPTETSMLVALADALIQAGNVKKAKQVVEGAAPHPGASTELQSTHLRGQIVERLALLGDAQAAENLVAAEAAQPARTILLGMFGVGRARAGNIADARRAAGTINSLLASSATAFAGASARAVADISLALSGSGALAEAVQTVMPLPDGLFKVQALSQVARFACRKDNAQTGAAQRGRTGLEQATAAARAAAAAANTPFLKADIAVAAGEAIASCKGADGVRSFIDETLAPELRSNALGTLVDRLTQQKQFAVARSILLAADPVDLVSLRDTARRLLKLGDRAKAMELAVKATPVPPPIPGAPTAGGYYFRLGSTADLFIELGAYDEAIATAQPIEINTRMQYYVRAVNGAVKSADAAMVTRLLSATIDALKADPPPGFGTKFRSLSDLAKMLAVAGYRDQALSAFAELQAMAAREPPNGPVRRAVAPVAALLQADGGDIAGALEAAGQIGPMVAKADLLTVVALAAITMGPNREKPATEAEAVEAIRRAAASLSLVAGPKAQVLSDIATHMAAKGDIAAALRVAAILEEEQNDAVKEVHDTAVNAIANAQIKAGDLRGAFATALRIRQPATRKAPLLKLAASPIVH